jgi:peptidoglycan/LPS O-acetylase OafA/YrhL
MAKRTGETMNKTVHTFLTLDAIRCVAAVAVVLKHMATNSTNWEPAGSYLAVNLFYALSGFVLAHAYADRFDHNLGIGEFLKIRLIRLYPLYFLGLSISVIRLAAGFLRPTNEIWAALIANILFLPVPPGAFASRVLYPLNPPAWTLFFEMLANIAMVALWGRIGRRCLAILMLVGILGMVGGAWAKGSLDVGWTWGGAPIALACLMFSFTIGVVIQRLFVKTSCDLIGVVE